MIYNILAQRCTKFRQRDRAILGQFIFRKIIYIKFSLLSHTATADLATEIPQPLVAEWRH